MHGTQVQSLVQEDPICSRAMKPITTTTKPARQRPRVVEVVLQLLKLACLETVLHNKRSHNQKVAPTRCSQRKPVSSHKDTAWPKVNKKIHNFRKRNMVHLQNEILLGNTAAWKNHKDMKGKELYSMMATFLIVPFIRYS